MNEAKRYGKDTSTDYLALKILINDITEISCHLESGAHKARANEPLGDDTLREEVAALRQTMSSQRQDMLEQGANLLKIQSSLEVVLLSVMTPQ